MSAPPSSDGLAEQVLELVRARAGAGAEAEVRVDSQRQALTRFANSYIHQNVAEQTTRVSLRLHAAGRTTTGTTTLTGSAGLADLVTRTVEAVRLAPPDPGWPGLAPPAPLHRDGRFDEATAATSPDERAARVREFVAEAAGLTAAGYCGTSHWAGSFANSAGQLLTARTTDATIAGMGRLGGSEGAARQTAVRLSDLDGAALGARAAAKARAGAEPVELPPGRYEVVLEPAAVADLLLHLGLSGFGGKVHAEGLSFVTLGEAQLDPSVTMVDDPFASGSPGYSYDGDGTPKRALVLVDAGVSRAVAHDRRSATLAGGGAVSTGHAVPGGSPFGPVPINLALLPTTGALPATAAMPGQVDPAAAPLVPAVTRGLLVTDLHYTRVLDTKTLVVTGLTRYGVWLIEDGEITAPVQNLRFTQSYPLALAPGAVKGIGATTTVLPAGWGTAWWRAPALHLASWHITGNASG
jgi:predicted Zn-dependent protease